MAFLLDNKMLFTILVFENREVAISYTAGMIARKVAVVGAGPAGMMAAVRAAELGCEVVLYEKEPQPGQKLSITGNYGGNITNSAPLDSFLLHYGKNGRFLSCAFSRFFNGDLVKFFAEKGVPTITGTDGRVFHATHNASHFVQCLLKYLANKRVVLIKKCTVHEILVAGRQVTGVKTAMGIDNCDRAILATGGLSYPRTGSTGDGYRIAGKLGHTVTKLGPALVPLEVKERGIVKLQGISLDNVALTLFKDSRRIVRTCGGIVFTHHGISGPAALALGKTVAHYANAKEISLHIDFVPASSRQDLDNALVSKIKECRGARIGKAIRSFVPGRLALFLVESAQIGMTRACSTISRAERGSLLSVLSDLKITGVSTRPIEEAMVTCGGLSLKEIDPRTMGSKLIKGLFLCGELIDIDGESGGYNLQAAFSTGYLAGESAALV